MEWARPAVLGLVLVDLAGLGWGLNPAIAADIHSYEPPVIKRLRQEMRTVAGHRHRRRTSAQRADAFGLCDIRNYDSVELARNLRWFAPLYEPGPGISSRSEITWQRVLASQRLLGESGVYAVVAAVPPPGGPFAREQIGRVWAALARWAAVGRARSPRSRLTVKRMTAGHDSDRIRPG